MTPIKLFMLMLGCTPPGRNTEQHDIYFTAARSIKDTVQEIKEFWPEAKGKIHIDAWREVNQVEQFSVEVISKDLAGDAVAEALEARLFFINLGGYRENEFDEFHYKMLVTASDKAAAIRLAKETAFYKHTGFDGAPSHIDDKFGVDVDDIYEIQEILPDKIKENYTIRLLPAESVQQDRIHLGYFKLDEL
ncbi:DUF1543 domain-containing protein [Flavihumibacter sp. R14]|nr:DUF1543 domain-containing protein [Flavihumibacter soli]